MQKRGPDLEGGADEEDVARADDDGDGGVDVGEGAAHDGGEPRAEVHLQERVDPGEEEDGLDHDRLLLLQCARRWSRRGGARAQVRKGREGKEDEAHMAAAHDGDEDGGDDDGGAEHDQVVLERDDHRGDCGKGGEAETSVRARNHW